MSEILKARVLAVDSVYVYICCPICRKLHKHASNGNINRQNYGYRVAHCCSSPLPWINGRFWDNPRHDSYELVCTSETLREKRDATEYVEEWYRKNRLTAYKRNRIWIAHRVMDLVDMEGITIAKAYERLMRDMDPQTQIT